MDVSCVLDVEGCSVQLSNAESAKVLLMAADTRFLGAQLLAATWSADPLQRQRVSESARLLVNECKDSELSHSVRSELRAGLEAFESRRVLVEGDRPFDFPWHGPTSRQRILLQDSRFVELLQDARTARSVVAAILADDCGMLSSTLLAALHCKLSLAYMLSASPNWESLPALETIHWDMAYSYVQHPRIAAEPPVHVSPPLLRSRVQALANVAGTFQELAELSGAAVAQEFSEIGSEVAVFSAVPFGELLARLREAVASPAQASALVNGPSGECADLFPMICQALCVVRHYAAASSELGSGSDALSLGAFSHALDAKHLAAGVHAMGWPAFPGDVFSAFLRGMPPGERGPGGKTLRKPVEELLLELHEGLQALRALLCRCESGDAEELETELIRWRLKQAIQLNLCLQVARR